MSKFDKAAVKPGEPHYRTSYEVQDKRGKKQNQKKRELQIKS